MSNVNPLFQQEHSNVSNLHKSPFFITVMSFIVGLIIGIAVFVIGSAIISNLEPNTNHLEGSNLYGGYLPFDIYKIYDAETGVYYAVTEQGGVTVMVDSEGNPLLVDGGKAL